MAERSADMLRLNVAADADTGDDLMVIDPMERKQVSTPSPPVPPLSQRGRRNSLGSGSPLPPPPVPPRPPRSLRPPPARRTPADTAQHPPSPKAGTDSSQQQPSSYLGWDGQSAVKRATDSELFLYFYDALRRAVGVWLKDTNTFSSSFDVLCSAIIASGLLLGGFVINGIFTLFPTATDDVATLSLTSYMAQWLIVALLLFFMSVLVAVLAKLTVSARDAALEHNFIQQFVYLYQVTRARNILAISLLCLACAVQITGLILTLWFVVCELPRLADNGWCRNGQTVPLVVVSTALLVVGTVGMLYFVLPTVDQIVFSKTSSTFECHVAVVPTWIYRGYRWDFSSRPWYLSLLTLGGVLDWLLHLLHALTAAALPCCFSPNVGALIYLPGGVQLQLVRVRDLRYDIAICNRKDCQRFLYSNDLVWHGGGSFDLHPWCLPLEPARNLDSVAQSIVPPEKPLVFTLRRCCFP